MRAKLIFSLGLFTLLAASSTAQVDVPRFAGLWCPRTGSSAVYRVTDKLEEVESISLVVTGHFEIATTYAGLDQHTIVQRFRQSGGSAPVLESVAAREPGLTARELPGGLLRGAGPPVLAVQVGNPVGQETLVVPAGSYDCAHYKMGQADVWLSPRVSPYGIVAYREPGFTLELASYSENLDGENR